MHRLPTPVIEVSMAITHPSIYWDTLKSSQPAHVHLKMNLTLLTSQLCTEPKTRFLLPCTRLRLDLQYE